MTQICLILSSRCLRPLILLVFIALALSTDRSASAAPTETLLYLFNPANGTDPTYNANNQLVQGANGSFYGTTSSASTTPYLGDVFSLTSTGIHSHLFTIPNSYSATVTAPLILATNGNFYGTFSGAIFTMTPSGTVTILHQAGDGSVANDSGYYNGLIQAADGNFYGTSVYGGTHGSGTFFKMTPAGAFTILHSFGDGSVANDGLYPYSRVVQGTDGNFYGTTQNGGDLTLAYNGLGTAYKVTPTGVVTILHQFGGVVYNDGSNPYSALLLGNDGNFYGTTRYGGNFTFHDGGSGTLFRMTPAGVITILHSFGESGDGYYPNTNLIQATDGHIYGTVANGGLHFGGIFFQLTLAGAYTPIYDFGVSGDVYYPTGVIQATDGNFYGTAGSGGPTYGGGFWKISLGLPPSAATPAITSLTSAFATSSQAFSYQIKATNNPTSFDVSGLPPGLTFNATTGLISGTPTWGGNYVVTLSASNASGTGVAVALALNVAYVKPVITSPAIAAVTANDYINYSITATNTPTKYTVSGLPAGLSFYDSLNYPGFSGTPTVAGTYPITITAANAAGTTTFVLTLTVAVDRRPVVTGPTAVTGTVGQPFSANIVAINTPTSYYSGTLPAGLTLNTTTGAITGTPTAPITTNILFSATNALGTSTYFSCQFTIVNGTLAPSITSPLTATATVGQAFTYQAQATNLPTGYTAVGLPGGLTITNAGYISGTPNSAGSYAVTLTAINANGQDAETLVLTVAAVNTNLPVITSSTTKSVIAGQAFSYQIVATKTPTGYAVTGLPVGLTYSTSTGLISGSVSTPGTYIATLTASNASGTCTPVNLTITVLPVPPVITSSLSVNATVGQAFSYAITTTGSATSYSASPLPGGLTFNTTTGILSGTPTLGGTYTVSISASNTGGTGSASLVITVSTASPIISSATTASGTKGQFFSYQITASNQPTLFGANGLPAGLSVNTATGLISGTPTTGGSFSVALTAKNGIGTGSATLTLTIATPAQTTQTITFNTVSNLRTNSGSFTLAATASSGLSITYSYISGPGTLSGNTVTLTGAAGTIVIQANQAGNATYAASSIQQSFVVRSLQKITFNTIANLSTSSVFFNLNATSNSGLPITYTYISGPGTLSGNKVTLTGTAGTIVIQANQPGNTTYVGSSIQQSFVILNSQTLTFNTVSYLNTATAYFNLNATANSGLPITYTFISGPATLSGNKVTLTGAAGTIVIQANQVGNSSYASSSIQQSFIVRTAQSLTFNTVSNLTTATASFNLSATASSGLPVTYTYISGPCTLAGNKVTLTGLAGTILIQANQIGNSTYASSSLQQSFVILSTQNLTFNTVSNLTTATASFNLSAVATSGLPVTYTYISGPCTLSGNKVTLTGVAGTIVIQANQIGNSTYAAATGITQSFIVAASGTSAQTVTIGVIPNQTVTSGSFTLSASTTSGLALTYTVSGPATLNGKVVTLTGETGKVTIIASQAGNSVYSSASATRSFTVTATSAGWTTKGNFVLGRFYHTSTLLTNGLVLVSGGSINTNADGGATPTTELYTPFRGTWTAAASMNIARTYHTATRLNNGSVLVTGGFNGAYLASAELYNPTTKLWTSTGNLSTARYDHTATLLPNGKVLVVGGFGGTGNYLATAELYDPATGVWTATGSLATARFNHSATLLTDGRVLVTGGSTTVALASSEIYNPTTGTWTATGAMVTARTTQTATCLNNGQVLVVGGFGTDWLSTTELYNPLTGTWSATGSLSAKRGYHTATLLTNGQVLIEGGGNADTLTAAAELYNPTTKLWTVKSSLAFARYNHTATLLPNGQIIVAGGQAATVLNSSECFDSYQLGIKIPQTLSAFPTISTRTLGTAPFNIALPVATSWLPVTVTVKSGPATISGSTITLTGAGQVVLAANQAGNAVYGVCPEVTTSFTVTKAAQATSYVTITTGKVGQTSILTAVSTSGLPVTFKVVSKSGYTGEAVIAGNQITFLSAGQIQLAIDQAGDTNYLPAPQLLQTITISL